ncbi:hypothetical protein D3C78_1548930 [compost metagenome]
MFNFNALYGRVIGIDRRHNAVAQELRQRMLRQRRHGAGLNVGRQTRFDTDAMFGEEVHQCRILNRFHAMANTFGTQFADRLPDAFRTRGFTCVYGDAQAGVAGAVEVAEEQAAREAQFVAGQIQCGNTVAVRQQAFQLL